MEFDVTNQEKIKEFFINFGESADYDPAITHEMFDYYLRFMDEGYELVCEEALKESYYDPKDPCLVYPDQTANQTAGFQQEYIYYNNLLQKQNICGPPTYAEWSLDTYLQ